MFLLLGSSSLVLSAQNKRWAYEMSLLEKRRDAVAEKNAVAWRETEQREGAQFADITDVFLKRIKELKSNIDHAKCPQSFAKAPLASCFCISCHSYHVCV